MYRLVQNCPRVPGWSVPWKISPTAFWFYATTYCPIRIVFWPWIDFKMTAVAGSWSGHYVDTFISVTIGIYGQEWRQQLRKEVSPVRSPGVCFFQEKMSWVRSKRKCLAKQVILQYNSSKIKRMQLVTSGWRKNPDFPGRRITLFFKQRFEK